MYARSPSRPKPRKSQAFKFPAPVAGWVANRSLSEPGSIEGPGASVLENYFPKATSVKLRRGKELYAQAGDGSSPCLSLFSYVNGTNQRLFAATTTAIYDVSGAPLAVSVGHTNGRWSVAQFATSGGVYLIGVNGEDTGFIFDGTTMTDFSVAFGTLTSADMSFVWVFKNRLYFAQKNSMTAWYMTDVDSIGGTTDFFPLAGVFGRGGSLLFGSAWSLDGTADAGLSEQCVFVSSEGEVAVYSGTDPSEADTFSKVGTYRIGRPLGNRAHFRGGGDLAIATSVGLVPLSKAVNIDVTSLAVATVSYRIADAWTDALTFRGYQDWQCEVWPEQKMAVVCPPKMEGGSDPVMFVSNTETGAWARYTNWQAYCTEVFQGALYFGSDSGQVFIANTGGSDAGEVYTGKVLPLFQDMGSPSSLKIGTVARAVTRANGKVNGSVILQVDYSEDIPPPPDASFVSADNNWGTAEWGSSLWGSTLPTVINQDWQSAGGAGYAMSLAYQLSSGSIIPLDDDMIRMELHFNTCEVVT